MNIAVEKSKTRANFIVIISEPNTVDYIINTFLGNQPFFKEKKILKSPLQYSKSIISFKL